MNKVIVLLKSNHTWDLNANRGLHSHSFYVYHISCSCLYEWHIVESSFFVGYIDIQQTLNVTQ